MKVKKGLILALVFVLIAGVLFTVGMSMLKWDFKALDNTKYTEQFFEATEETEEITKIKLDTHFSVNVVQGEKLTLKYYDVENKATDLKVENGVLSLKDARAPWYRFFRFYNRKLELTVPANTDLVLESTNASLTLENAQLGDIDLDITNLDLDFKNCTFGDMNIDSTNLKADFTDCTAESFTIDSTNQKINLLGSTAASYTAKGSNQRLDLSGSEIGSVTLDSDNLRISASALDVSKITMESTNIKSELKLVAPKEEYTILSDTVNGNPPASQTGSDPEKLLKIRTVNWSGFVTFG